MTSDNFLYMSGYVLNYKVENQHKIIRNGGRWNSELIQKGSYYVS